MKREALATELRERLLVALFNIYKYTHTHTHVYMYTCMQKEALTIELRKGLRVIC